VRELRLKYQNTTGYCMDIYDICYGLTEWKDSQDADAYLTDVLQTSYR
jgi:hypothetical protein